MNRIIRSLVIAAPLATAALTLTTGTAHAAAPAPTAVGVSTVVDPCPEPVPGGPRRGGDCDPEPCTPIPGGPNPCDEPGDGGGGDGGGDGTPGGDKPIGIPEPCPTHGECPGDGPGDGGDGPGDGGDGPGDGPGNGNDVPGGDDQGCFTGCDLDGAGIPLPTRIDAGVAPQQDGDLELTWILLGGALVSASGAAYAARARSRA